MIKWVSLILQLLMLKNSFTKSSRAFEYAEHAAESAKGYFVFSVGSIFSVLFLVVAMVTGVLGIGLQIEQGQFPSFSSQVISAVIFLGIAIFIFLVSWILMLMQKRAIEAAREERRRQESHGSLGSIFEEFLKEVLTNLTQKPKQSKSARSVAKNEAPDSSEDPV